MNAEAFLSLELRRQRKDRLLSLKARHIARARELERLFVASRRPDPLALRISAHYRHAYRFELVAWAAFGAPM